MVTVLVVAQLPPPYLGQPIMVEHLVRSKMNGVQLRHLSMRLSQETADVGRFSWLKLLRLFPIIARIIYARFAWNPDILYFAPAAATRLSMCRDFVILIATRFLFPRTVFHFHASGHAALYAKLPAWQQWLFRLAYFHADAAIRLSELTPQDGKGLEARREFVVANGIDDPCPVEPRSETAPAAEQTPLQVLFVGALCESKGLLILIEACGELAARRVPFQLRIMGRFQTDEFEARVRQRIAELGLDPHVQFLGQLTGADKLAAFSNADVLCHPTVLDTFPVVLLEAMAFRLPVVATRLSGIPTIVDHEKTGYLVAPHAPGEVADRLAQLAQNADLRKAMGAAARDKFLREYSLDRHIARMRSVFLEVAGTLPLEDRIPAGRSMEPVQQS